MEKNWGGPPVVVSNLVNNLSTNNCQLEIWSTYSNDNNDMYMDKDSKHQSFLRSRYHKYWKGYSDSLKRKIQSDINNFDLVHIHEMWNYPHYITAKECIKRKIPYIITVHGGLNDKAIQLKNLRKYIYSLFVQKYILNNASMIHVFTENEKAQVNLYKKSKDIVILPNGVEYPPPIFQDYKKN